MTMDERERPDGTTGPSREPSGELGGHPVNADETAPREHTPDPPEGGNRQPREPDAVDDEPGQDL